MATDKNPFKIIGANAPEKVDIESLFKDLKNRVPEVRALYAHQADILRDYYKSYLESKDVSLQLPTGSGKTLVGLLIAEWRRKILGQRVLYLCPTRQLANQVGQHSKEYGIETRVFIGQKKYYDMKDLMLYRKAQVIAISTYSGLFNNNPGLNDPQIIILDDAHGAESYISSMWSLAIDRAKSAILFDKIIDVFKNDISPNLVAKIKGTTNAKIPLKSEKVPLGAFYRKTVTLRNVIDANIPSDNLELYYPWLNLRESLQACHIYLSEDEILIRPYICPTLTHKPFENADQRIYMSATLGRGGELERITGVEKISRIPTPETYKSRSIGRRFFIFPDLLKEQNDYSSWIAHRLSSVRRTLALCPNKFEAYKFRHIAENSQKTLTIFEAKDIEEDLRTFTASNNSLLLLTNRYDGIDLPHGICRQIVLNGLPSRTNLQETFLEERLGLDILLGERIKTRIEQASGRCTRSDTDSAAVIMIGHKLLDFCSRKENQKIFHPEIRAEIQFALDQENSIQDVEAMVASFIDQDKYWTLAEQDIARRRSEELPDSSVTNILEGVVKAEVEFAYSMWIQDYERAVEHGRRVVDGLSGNKVSSYRALWCFFAAGAAYIHSETDKKFEAVALDLMKRAKAACKTVSWFPNELKFMLPERISVEDASDAQARQIEGILELLSGLGSTGPKFESKMKEVNELLISTDANKFDRGLVELGLMLGFTSWKPAGKAAPDCVWQLGYKMLFIFEGKSDESPEAGVSVQNCRQASGHHNWARAESDLNDLEDKYSILATPKLTLGKDAIPYTDDIYFLWIPDILKLFEKIKCALSESREMMTTEASNETRERVLQKLTQMNITAEEIHALVTSKQVKDLPIS
jgi:hypothetical protein